MYVLKQAMIGNQQYSVAEINRCSGSTWEQFWEERTTIWTSKYGESADASGRETDQNDCNSSYVVLVEGLSHVIAGTRLIHADPADKNAPLLPLEECLHYHIGERAAEVSRFFFAPSTGSLPEEAKSQLKLFIWGIVTSLKNEGYQRAYATIRERLFAKLQEFGVPMQRITGLAEGKHGNKKFVPAILFEPAAEPSAQSQPKSTSLLVAA